MRKEYIEREAAYNAIVNNYTTDAQLRDLDAIPAADVVEVVRCRECKMANLCSVDRVVYCTMTHAYKPSNFFCADGARMDGAGDG